MRELVSNLPLKNMSSSLSKSVQITRKHQMTHTLAESNTASAAAADAVGVVQVPMQEEDKVSYHNNVLHT